jgi:alpha-methylacyl-CoA racemase
VSGPLTGIRVLELQGMGPGPFAGMVLADMGASVLRIDRPGRPGGGAEPAGHAMSRGKETIGLNLKDPDDLARVWAFIAQADALLDCYRPGAMERLGLGPDECLERRPSLVYARMTGWGQDGPMAQAAGHDLNYLALSGVLAHVGRAGQPPTPPLNLVADYGGGGMLVAFGIVCGILNARATGQGDVIDAAMIDGAALLMTSIFEEVALGNWQLERGVNILDSGAPFYEVYETADGRHVAIGATDPPSFAEFLRKIGLDGLAEGGPDWQPWAETKEVIAARIRTRTREEWVQAIGDADVSFTPVLNLDEAPRHPHNAHRGGFFRLEEITQPAPAPRFARAAPSVPTAGRSYAPGDSVWSDSVPADKSN